MKTIELNDSDSAYIVRDDGTEEIYVPVTGDQNAPICNSAFAILKVIMTVHDPHVLKAIQESLDREEVEMRKEEGSLN
jgi:hypothetical protein